MSKRVLSRRPNGRFRRATVQNTFGLDTHICTSCRAINTNKIGESKPDKCHKCGGKEFE